MTRVEVAIHAYASVCAVVSAYLSVSVTTCLCVCLGDLVGQKLSFCHSACLFLGLAVRVSIVSVFA